MRENETRSGRTLFSRKNTPIITRIRGPVIERGLTAGPRVPRLKMANCHSAIPNTWARGSQAWDGRAAADFDSPRPEVELEKGGTRGICCEDHRRGEVYRPR